jgi:hypothetical protein
MYSRELVDHIRCGPAVLLLNTTLRFRRRTCFNGRLNPCDFDVFLQALQASETIRNVQCCSQQTLGISEDQWVLLVKTIGRIRDIQSLSIRYTAGSRDFRPFQAVTDAVKNARSLCKLIIALDDQTLPRDSSGLTALANALREHAALQEFRWIDFNSRMQAPPPDLSLDPVLQALPACPHIQEVVIVTQCASAGAMKNLLKMGPTTDLFLEVNTEHWLAVADGIRQGRCNIKNLYLLQSASFEDTEAIKALAGAIRLDQNLERLKLHMMNALTNEAGVALAEALSANKTLRKITLYLRPSSQGQGADLLSAPVYEAFCAMLRVNTTLLLELSSSDDAGGRDRRLVDSRNQMRIEQELNYVGRGRLLSSSQTPREEWVDALNELNSSNVDESPEFIVSCLYSLLRLNPATCM